MIAQTRTYVLNLVILLEHFLLTWVQNQVHRPQVELCNNINDVSIPAIIALLLVWSVFDKSNCLQWESSIQLSPLLFHHTKAALCKLFRLLPPTPHDLYYLPSLFSPAWLSPAVLLGPLSTQPLCVISLSTCQWKGDLFNVFEEPTTRSLKTLSLGVQGAVCLFIFFASFSCIVTLNHSSPKAGSLWLPSLSDVMPLWMPAASHHRETDETWRKKYEVINS